MPVACSVALGLCPQQPGAASTLSSMLPNRSQTTAVFVCLLCCTHQSAQHLAGAPVTKQGVPSGSSGCGWGAQVRGTHQPTSRCQHPLTLLCWTHAARPPQTDGQHRWGWKPAAARMTGEIRVWKGRKPARSAPHLLQRDAQRLGAHGILGGAAPLHLLLALLSVAPVG